MANWQSQTKMLGTIPPYANPCAFAVQADGGTVRIERPNATTDAWVTVEEYTVNTTTRLDLAGSEGWRIVATGEARFLLGAFI